MTRKLKLKAVFAPLQFSKRVLRCKQKKVCNSVDALLTVTGICMTLAAFFAFFQKYYVFENPTFTRTIRIWLIWLFGIKTVAAYVICVKSQYFNDCNPWLTGMY